MRPIKFMHQPVKRVCVRRHVKTRRGGSHFIQLWDPFLPKSRKEVVSSVDWQSGSMRRGWKLYTFKRHSDPKHPAQLDAEELSSRLEGLDGENHRFYITHTHFVHMMPSVDEHPPVCCQTPRVPLLEGAVLAEFDAKRWRLF